jgi:hypothetical protein
MEQPMVAMEPANRIAALIGAALLVCAAAPVLAQKNEGMGVVAPSKPILKEMELDAAAAPSIGSAPRPTTSSPRKTRAPKAKKSDPSEPK